MKGERLFYKKIKNLRVKIDFLDKKILKLLEKRIKLAKKIIFLKTRQGLSIEDPQREKEILEKILKRAKDKDLKNFLPKIYKILFEAAKNSFKGQKMKKIKM